MGNNSYHHGDLKSELMKAATAILRNEGIDSITMRGLSSELNVSRTAPYRHFKDKEELLCAIAKEGFRIFGRGMATTWEQNIERPAAERFAEVGYSYIKFSSEYPEYYSLMFGNHSLLKHSNSQLKEEADSTFNALKEMLSYCQDEGVFEVEDKVLQARFVWCALHGYCSIITTNTNEIAASMLDDSRLFLDKIICGLTKK